MIDYKVLAKDSYRICGELNYKVLMKDVYEMCGKILKEEGEIDFLPELKLTYAKGYYGKITVGQHIPSKKIISIVIKLSRYNLDCGKLWKKEDINRLILTICHELAHMIYFDHGKDHSRLTRKYVDIVLRKTAYKNYKRNKAA